jgi:arsenite methyltransferase
MEDTMELADGYTTRNSTQRDASDFLLQRLIINSGMRVLDIGCGPGDITSRIADLVGKKGIVVGIDPSRERISLANREERTKENLSFQVGSAEDLSRFANESFDMVFVNSTLHWVQDQTMAIKEFVRVLKPGGQIGISGGSGDYYTHQERIKAEVLSLDPYAQYPEESPPKFLKRTELENLLHSAGINNIDFAINKIVKLARDADEMIDWLDTSSSGRTYGGIPLWMRPSAREQMKHKWAELATKEGIQMNMELLVTVAIKS